jgi:hypothetical protein
MAASCAEQVQIFLEQMALGASSFERFQGLSAFKGSDEIQITSLFASIAHWRRHFPEDFSVVHDASSNVARSREIWERATNIDVPPQFHPAGDGGMVEFPLRVVSTTHVDSRQNYAVQLCDILAGLAARHFDSRIEGGDRDLLNAAVEAGLGAIDYNGVRPDFVFPDHIPPRRLDGPDVVERLRHVLFGPHNETRF